MKIAHILPPSVLQEAGHHMQDYYLLLPSLVTDDRYRDFYRDLSGLKIMDNGIAEGNRVSFRHQLYRGMVTKCEEIILPDVMKNMDATLNAVASAFFEAFEERALFRYMLVAQGETVLDCVSTVERAMNMFPGIVNAVGVPRHILDQGRNARFEIVQRLRERQGLLYMPIHLLGTHPLYPRELFKLGEGYRKFGVRGVDTSLAWNATLASRYLTAEATAAIPRQPIEEFMKGKVSDIDIDLLHKNMQVLNKWVSE